MTAATRSAVAFRLRLTLLAALAATALVPANAVAGDEAAAPPQLDASSWLLIDGKDNAELAAHAPDRHSAIASTTKLMTAFLAMSELRMSDVLVVPRYEPEPAESVAGLVAGERLTVRDLLIAMMLPSANDAAVTVADGVSGSEGAFVAAMNSAATRLGLDRTHYANPIGLDAGDNYSTADDLLTLAQELLADKRFRRIVAMPRATLRSGDHDRVVTNTNTLLRSDPTVDGVKTGHTLEAGYVLVASAKRDGVPLLAAVLGAPSEAARDVETEELLDWGYSLYHRERAVVRGRTEATASVRYDDRPLALVARRSIPVEVRDDQRVEIDARAPTEVEGPIAVGERLGEVTVAVDGRFVDRVPLTAGRAIAAPTIVDRVGGPAVVALIIGTAIVILALAAIALRRRSRGGAEAIGTRRRE